MNGDRPAVDDAAERALLAALGAVTVAALRAAPLCRCRPCEQLREVAEDLDLLERAQ